MSNNKKPISYFNFKSLFTKMDQGLQKYYSSKQSNHQNNNNLYDNACTCVLERQQKDLQIQFYTNQYQLVQQSLQNILDKSKSSQQNYSYIKFMGLMKDYLQKILYLLSKKYLCYCKSKIINQFLNNDHKMSFLRQQNDKFFKLYQEKSQQCQLLKQKIKQLSTQSQIIKKLQNFNISQSNTSPICHINLNNPNINDLKSINFSKLNQSNQESRKTAKSSTNNIYHKLSIDVQQIDKDNSKKSSQLLSNQNQNLGSIQSSKISEIQPNQEQQRHVLKSIFEANHQKYFKQNDSQLLKKQGNTPTVASSKRARLFNNQNSITSSNNYTFKKIY